jgi:hypothetical protein
MYYLQTINTKTSYDDSVAWDVGGVIHKKRLHGHNQNEDPPRKRRKICYPAEEICLPPQEEKHDGPKMNSRKRRTDSKTESGLKHRKF